MKRTPRRPPAVLVLLVPALMLVVPWVLAQDSEKFQEVLSRAEQGDAVAQFNLGVMYGRGEGVPEDDAEAVKWYRKAAEQGLASTQFELGVMYYMGEGVQSVTPVRTLGDWQDPAPGFRWRKMLIINSPLKSNN